MAMRSKIRGRRTRTQDNAVYPLWHRAFKRNVQRKMNNACKKRLLAVIHFAVAINEIVLKTK
jgi:hypothetical protein